VLDVPASRLVLGRGRIVAPIARPERFLYALLATFLLTGGRRAEVFGLELGDVIQKRGVVAFRPNQRRRLKTKTSQRTVPLWPQLREILGPYIEHRREQGAEDADLLFPSQFGGGLLDNIDKALDTVAEHAGWKRGEVRTKAFRHAYCTARLQTLDRGFPVSEFVVAREMGHGGHELVRRVYGHLGEIRHRSETVEYRIEQQREVIPPERLRLLFRAA
jgi:integrase